MTEYDVEDRRSSFEIIATYSVVWLVLIPLGVLFFLVVITIGLLKGDNDDLTPATPIRKFKASLP